MKSLPRPWYLTKCKNPLSLRSRKEICDSFSKASILMEVAETRKLRFRRATVFNPRKLGCTEEEEKNLSEVSERRVREWRVGEVRGRKMVAAMAMALRFSLGVCLPMPGQSAIGGCKSISNGSIWGSKSYKWNLKQYFGILN